MHKQATRPPRKSAQTSTRAKSLPQKYFVSPEIFIAEQTEIFSKGWLLVGHQSQIPNAGDYMVVSVPPSQPGYGVTSPPTSDSGATSESLIVIRDKSAKVHGFFNVCRHRGSRLCEARNGHLSAIQCPYHAWTYGLDGRLIGAPHMDEVPGFDKADYPLHTVNVGVWEGFIFVNLEKNPMPLEKWFAPLAGKFTDWDMSILRSAKRIQYDVKANWKLLFENCSECYHCPGVHPQL